MLLRRSSTRTSDPRMPPRTTAPSTTMSVQSAPTASANARSPIAPMFNAPTTSVMSPRPLVVVSRAFRKSIADQHSDGRSNEDRNDVDHRSKAGHGKRLQSESIQIGLIRLEAEPLIEAICRFARRPTREAHVLRSPLPRLIDRCNIERLTNTKPPG